MAPVTQYVFAEMLGISEHFTAGSHEWLPYSDFSTFPKQYDKHQFAGEKILVTEKSQARLDAPGIYVLYSSAQVRAHLTAFCQPWSSCSRWESSMAGVNTFSMAQLFFTSSRLLQ